MSYLLVSQFFEMTEKKKKTEKKDGGRMKDKF